MHSWGRRRSEKMQCSWPTSEAPNNGLHQMGEVSLGGLSGAVTLLGFWSDVSHCSAGPRVRPHVCGSGCSFLLAGEGKRETPVPTSWAGVWVAVVAGGCGPPQMEVSECRRRSRLAGHGESPIVRVTSVLQRLGSGRPGDLFLQSSWVLPWMILHIFISHWPNSQLCILTA